MGWKSRNLSNSSWIQDRECWTILTLGMEGAAAFGKLLNWAGDVVETGA